MELRNGERTIDRIDILPGFLATHHVVHFLSFQVLACSHLSNDGEFVRTCVTGPLVVALIIQLDDEAVGACWAEEHGRVVISAGRRFTSRT